MSDLQKQELYCHNCRNYVQFQLDMELEGNHVLKCPECGHEHCRVVQKGKITDIRWDQRNGPVNNLPIYNVSSQYLTTSTTSIYVSTDTTDYFIRSSWLNTSTFNSNPFYSISTTGTVT